MGLDSVTALKAVYSVPLLIFSIILIMTLIFEEKTTLSEQVHPGLAVVTFWAAIIWLSMVEGEQASLVGLPPVDRDLYKESHPLSHKCTSLAHKGDNLDRYLMGRQFMVIFIVFIINYSGAPTADAEVLGLPDIITKIFLGAGLGMILVTCNIGQLATQVNASHCMLDYINNWFAVFTLWVCMVVEFSGFMHICYAIQMVAGQIAGKPIESKEPPRDGAQNAFFWGRVVFSAVVLVFCLAVTFKALFDGNTTMWDGVPAIVSIILFIILLSVVGMLEGMQIAFFAVTKVAESERGDSMFAKMTCQTLFKGEGRNLPGFMVGRQLCVVSCFFVIARVTTLDIGDEDENIFGVSDGLQNFFNLGFLGAVITTVLGSISWQLVASAFPLPMLAFPPTYVLLRVCLLLEATGLCAAAWVLAYIQATVSGFQRDEVYVGTPEERAARKKPDAEEGEDPALTRGHIYPGTTLPHPVGLPGGIDEASGGSAMSA